MRLQDSSLSTCLANSIYTTISSGYRKSSLFEYSVTDSTTVISRTCEVVVSIRRYIPPEQKLTRSVGRCCDLATKGLAKCKSSSLLSQSIRYDPYAPTQICNKATANTPLVSVERRDFDCDGRLFLDSMRP